MKKLLIILLSLSLVFSFVGCKKEDLKAPLYGTWSASVSIEDLIKQEFNQTLINEAFDCDLSDVLNVNDLHFPNCSVSLSLNEDGTYKMEALEGWYETVINKVVDWFNDCDSEAFFRTMLEAEVESMGFTFADIQKAYNLKTATEIMATQGLYFDDIVNMMREVYVSLADEYEAMIPTEIGTWEFVEGKVKLTADGIFSTYTYDSAANTLSVVEEPFGLITFHK